MAWDFSDFDRDEKEVDLSKERLGGMFGGTSVPGAVRVARDAADEMIFDKDAPTYEDYTKAAQGDEEARAKVNRHSVAMAIGSLNSIRVPKVKPSLAMDEASRMARAKEMGFDTDKTYYHGTKADINEFHKSPRALDAVYLAESPETANGYAASRPYGEQKGGNNVLPVNVAVKKTWDYNNGHNVEQLINEIKSTTGKQFYPEDFSHEGESGKGNWRLMESPEVTTALKKLGFDSAKISEDGVSNLAVFEPNQIRSKFAEFDPKKKDSGNISAALAGASALGAGALSSQESQASQPEYDFSDFEKDAQ